MAAGVGLPLQLVALEEVVERTCNTGQIQLHCHQLLVSQWEREVRDQAHQRHPEFKEVPLMCGTVHQMLLLHTAETAELRRQVASVEEWRVPLILLHKVRVQRMAAPAVFLEAVVEVTAEIVLEGPVFGVAVVAVVVVRLRAAQVVHQFLVVQVVRVDLEQVGLQVHLVLFQEAVVEEEVMVMVQLVPERREL